MYNVIIAICVITIIGVNIIINTSFATILNLILSFALILVPSLFVLILVRFCPQKWFKWKIFKVGRKEYKFYDKIKIRKWKDKIPECGGLVNFKKDKLAPNPKDKKYILKFIDETYYAEITHALMIITAFIGFLFVPKELKIPMGLPILIAYSLLNIPSILIQRHTRYRLMKFSYKLPNVCEQEEMVEVEAIK